MEPSGEIDREKKRRTDIKLPGIVHQMYKLKYRHSECEDLVCESRIPVHNM